MGQIISQFPGGGEDVTAEVTAQTPIIDQIQTALIGKVGDDANATAETILEGYKAWVQGQKITGELTASDLLPEALLNITKMTKLEIDTFTYQSQTSAYNTAITHSLGETPELVLLLTDLSDTLGENEIALGVIFSNNAENRSATGVFFDHNDNNGLGYTPSTSGGFSVNSNNVIFVTYSLYGSSYFAAGATYTLITMA